MFTLNTLLFVTFVLAFDKIKILLSRMISSIVWHVNAAYPCSRDIIPVQVIIAWTFCNAQFWEELLYGLIRDVASKQKTIDAILKQFLAKWVIKANWKYFHLDGLNDQWNEMANMLTSIWKCLITQYKSITFKIACK